MKIKRILSLFIVCFFVSACNGQEPVEECKSMRFDVRNPNVITESRMGEVAYFHVMYAEKNTIRFLDEKNNDITDNYISELKPFYESKVQEENHKFPEDANELYKIFKKYNIKTISLSSLENESYENNFLQICE